MSIKLGDYFESSTTTVSILPYGSFLSFDIDDSHDDARGHIASNISVAEAKRIRDELDSAIKSIEEKAN
ncbi:hypothetical protein [Streptomyces sp. NBC_01751]|uniref:hypothetical protein n=1 Tax=Streptomyces sp. NBC_01751 TaxID=2975929 RepID=UPI002DDBB3C1|nr:hypothetical protein [Streptomyces sp. NBC_01751]WSD24525.1 hypothetical protein OHA26_14110 [Streptomyces sp. NBC_01751]